MVWTVASASVAPGIWTRMEFEPCSCTVASEEPRAFTRFSTMLLAVSMSDEDTVEPSDLLAVRITDTPPWMSRPCVMRWERGVKPMMHTTQRTAMAMSVPTYLRASPRSRGFLDVFLGFLAFGASVAFHLSTPVRASSLFELRPIATNLLSRLPRSNPWQRNAAASHAYNSLQL